jgi:hypothetical protein
LGPLTIHPFMLVVDLVLFVPTLFIVPQLWQSLRVELRACREIRATLAALILLVLVVWDLAVAMALVGLVTNRTIVAW